MTFSAFDAQRRFAVDLKAVERNLLRSGELLAELNFTAGLRAAHARITADLLVAKYTGDTAAIDRLTVEYQILDAALNAPKGTRAA